MSDDSTVIIIDSDWREHKRLILSTIDKNSDRITQNEKQLSEQKLHLQRIEQNTEVIKGWMRSEKVENDKKAEQERTNNQTLKKQGLSIVSQIIIAIITGVVTLGTILLTGLIDKIK